MQSGPHGEHTDRDYHERYLSDFSFAKFRLFADRMRAALAHSYRYSPTPILLSAGRFERLARITESLIRLLQAPAYQTHMLEKEWFLPRVPLRQEDYFGEVEFHVGEREEKIIEVNFCPPGHIGLLEIVETEFLNAMELDWVRGVNAGFERSLVETVTEGFRHDRIAIGVSHLEASAPYLPHYRYFESIFAGHGVEGRVVYASDVAVDPEGFPVWDGVRYRRILNLLIPRVWQDNREVFREYSRVFETRPEVFFLNPWGWRLGTKALLRVCHNLDRHGFGLAEEDISVLGQAALKTHLMSEFGTPEEVIREFGPGVGFVVKPLDNYHVRGVAIKPSIERLASIFESAREEFVIQEYFAPGSIPYIQPDGSRVERLFSPRVLFFNGAVFGSRAYTFTNPATYEDLAPVLVV